MSQTPDTLLYTGLNAGQLLPKDIYVTPSGTGTQTTLDKALLGAQTVSIQIQTQILGIPFFIAPYAAKIIGIVGRVENPVGGAGTLQPVKAANGVAIFDDACVDLTTAPFDADGDAAVNQVLPLSETASDLLLAPGDCLAFEDSGNPANGQGCITFFLVAV